MYTPDYVLGKGVDEGNKILPYTLISEETTMVEKKSDSSVQTISTKD
jgi:hypothetical protein